VIRGEGESARPAVITPHVIDHVDMENAQEWFNGSPFADNIINRKSWRKLDAAELSRGAA